MIRYTLKIDATGERELYSNIVFTAGDARGYRLDFSFYNGKEKISTEGCALSVKAKRADGAVVIDSGVIRGEECYWVAADNAYSVGGSLELEVALSKTDGTFVTTCVVFASVREGFGEKGLASSDNEPILAKLSAQSLLAQAAVSAHKTDAGAHAALFEKERATFNPLYSPAFIDETESDTELSVADAVDTTPIALSIYGACTEALPEGVTEKSFENPAVITGVGESGSVTVTMTDGEGMENIRDIILPKALYGLFGDTTRRGDYVDYVDLTSGEIHYQTKIIAFDGSEEWYGYEQNESVGRATAYLQLKNVTDLMIGLVPSVCSHLQTVYTGNGFNRARVYSTNGTVGWVGIELPLSNFPDLDSIKRWLSQQSEGGTPVTLIYPGVEQVEKTERVLLQSTSEMTIKNSAGGVMKAKYHRDIKSAYEELKNAIIAMGGVI